MRCSCKLSRSLVDATQKGDKSPLGACWGEMPWLGGAEPERSEAPGCFDEQGKPRRNKLLVRSATNAYFPQNVSAISIPADAGKQAIREAAEQAWGDLEAAEGADDVAHELKKAKYKHLRDRFSALELWAEVQRKKSGAVEERRGIKAAELDRFLATAESAGEDTPEKEDFFANALSLDPGRIGSMRRVSRIVLVHRLCEVSVQLGFTRFEAPARDVDYELSLGVRTAPLAREVTWLPAVENRGEGIFLALDPDHIKPWRTRREVEARETQLISGFEAWKKRRQVKSARFPGVTYVMLHSLSHLLLTAVSLECGYAASSNDVGRRCAGAGGAAKDRRERGRARQPLPPRGRGARRRDRSRAEGGAGVDGAGAPRGVDARHQGGRRAALRAGAAFGARLEL